MKTTTYDACHPAVRTLAKRDPVMADLSEQIDSISFGTDEDYFTSLVDTIVQQQLSLKAAHTIYQRLVELWGSVEPSVILESSDEQMRACGLSYSKISYLRDLSLKTQSGELDLASLDSMDSGEVVKQLTRVKGIGPWSAEMFLVFALGREDVFSPGDGGVKQALKRSYGIDPDDRAAVERLADSWAPYRSIAMLYLWESLRLPGGPQS